MQTSSKMIKLVQKRLHTDSYRAICTVHCERLESFVEHIT